MKYELETLEKLVASFTTRDANLSKNEVSKLLKNEAWKAEKAIIHNLLLQNNTTLLRTYFTVHVQKLVELCDKLYDTHGLQKGGDEINAVLELLGALKKAVPDLIDRSIALPKAFRIIQGAIFKTEWGDFVPKLKQLRASPQLLNIAVLPIDEFISLERKLSWFHYIWLKQYLAELKNIDFSQYEPYPSPEHLIHECLIQMDFNHPRFIAYCSTVIKDNADNFQELKEQLLAFNKSKKIIRQLPIISAEPFYQKQQSVIKDLCKWIDEEVDFRNLYDNGVYMSIGKKTHINPYKYVYDMTLEQLAFWKKLQYDHKVYVEDNLEKFSVKVAYNSSTKNKEILSLGSINSKFYSKDLKVIAPIFELIAAMIATIQPTLELLQRMLDDLRPFMG
jgi:hypothetical protein